VALAIWAPKSFTGAIGTALAAMAYNSSGLSLGAGNRQNSTPIPPIITGCFSFLFFLNFKFFFFFFCLLYQWIVNKIITLKKKPLNFLMQSLQFLIPGKVWVYYWAWSRCRTS
jgi:hypothetical protein